MAQTSRLASMVPQESLGPSAWSRCGMPSRIHFRSASFTQACWSGWSRARPYHPRPTRSPSPAQTQKAARQPKCSMIAVMMGGVKAAPAPTPAKIRPLARPRSAVGIQWATQRFELGYMTDSPTPSRKRTLQNSIRACTKPAGTLAVSVVKTAHHVAPNTSTRRGPRRSAAQPPPI